MNQKKESKTLLKTLCIHDLLSAGFTVKQIANINFSDLFATMDQNISIISDFLNYNSHLLEAEIGLTDYPYIFHVKNHSNKDNIKAENNGNGGIEITMIDKNTDKETKIIDSKALSSLLYVFSNDSYITFNTMKPKDIFIDYAKDKITEKTDFYYWKDSNENLVKFPIIYKLKNLRNFGETFILQDPDFDDGLVFITKDKINDMGKPYYTKMIDPFILISDLKFYEISNDFYQNILSYWDEICMEDSFEKEKEVEQEC